MARLKLVIMLVMAKMPVKIMVAQITAAKVKKRRKLPKRRLLKKKLRKKRLKLRQKPKKKLGRKKLPIAPIRPVVAHLTRRQIPMQRKCQRPVQLII